MILLRTAIAGITLCIAGLAMAQAPVDFGGNWALNTDKGENLGMVAALTETLVITQTGAQMTLDFTDVFQGKTSTRQVTYDLGGAAVENFAAMGDPSKTASQWIDGQLVTTWTSEGAIAGSEVVRTETRALSDDGMIMTVTTARSDNPAMVLVYEKQQ
jgi:hypothetical protein